MRFLVILLAIGVLMGQELNETSRQDFQLRLNTQADTIKAMGQALSELYVRLETYERRATATDKRLDRIKCAVKYLSPLVAEPLCGSL